jgi:low affinity Fe/Cu permease
MKTATEIIEKQKKDTKNKISKNVEELTRLCAENFGYFRGYTDDDLYNISMSFIFFLSAIIIQNNQHLSGESQQNLTLDMNKRVERLVKKTTGKSHSEIMTFKMTGMNARERRNYLKKIERERLKRRRELYNKF